MFLFIGGFAISWRYDDIDIGIDIDIHVGLVLVSLQLKFISKSFLHTLHPEKNVLFYSTKWSTSQLAYLYTSTFQL